MKILIKRKKVIIILQRYATNLLAKSIEDLNGRQNEFVCFHSALTQKSSILSYDDDEEEEEDDEEEDSDIFGESDRDDEDDDATVSLFQLLPCSL